MTRAIHQLRLPVRRILFLIGALTTLSATTALGQEEIKLNTRRLSERVLLTWACDYFQGTNMGVIVTDQGLVVIDTGLSPTTVRRQRDLVERELGRSDFQYLINTHMHNDHAFANQVFPEATVVGPGNGADALRREVELIPELMERLRSSQESYGEWAAGTSPDSAEGRHAREGAAAFEVGIADLERGIEPRFPTATFDDRHTLDLGDLRIELFEFAGFHSDSDILILVPEERTLFTGDVFWGGQLPILRADAPEGFHRLMDHWRLILESSPDLQFVIPGHSDVPLTVDQFRNMYQYLSRLWADVQAAKETDTPLLRFLMQNVFAERYPEVADFNFIRRDYNLHQHNIYVLWSLAGG
jgi:glyoxylase-like metal-dependent hydrolase (beta-lactamase superfamily II)